MKRFSNLKYYNCKCPLNIPYEIGSSKKINPNLARVAESKIRVAKNPF